MKVYIPDHDETIADAIQLPPTIIDHTYADEAAEYLFTHRDGWEWSWPIIIVLVGEMGDESKWLVDCEQSPCFSSRRVK